MTGPLAGLRVLDVGTRIAAPFCAGLLGEQGAEVIKVEQPGTGRLHAHDRSVRRDGLFAVLGGRGPRAARASRSICAQTEGQDLFRRLAADGRRACARTSGPARWSAGASAPADLDPRLVIVRICGVRPGRAVLAAARPRPPGHRLRRPAPPHRLPRPPPGAPRRDDRATTSPACSRPRPRGRALPARRGRSATGRGAVIDAALYGSVLRILEWTLAGYDRLGVVRRARRQPAGQLGTARQLPDRRRPVRLHRRRLATPTSRGCARPWTVRISCPTRGSPGSPTGPARSDEINGIVADWTSALPAAADRRACDRPRRASRDRVHSRRHLRRSPHGGSRRPRHRRRPGPGSGAPAGPVPAFVGEPAPVPTGAPRLGEHTREVLAGWLGLTETNIDALAKSGVTQ